MSRSNDQRRHNLGETVAGPSASITQPSPPSDTPSHHLSSNFTPSASKAQPGHIAGKVTSSPCAGCVFAVGGLDGSGVISGALATGTERRQCNVSVETFDGWNLRRIVAVQRRPGAARCPRGPLICVPSLVELGGPPEHVSCPARGELGVVDRCARDEERDSHEGAHFA